MKDKNQIDSSNNETPTSRRRIIKTLALGGGAVASSKTLPEAWKKPMLNQVVLPGHAEMTTTVVTPGVYTSSRVLALNLPTFDPGFAPKQFALLDSLVSPLHASHSNAQLFCGNTDDDYNGDDGVVGNSRVYIRINEDMSPPCT